MCAISVPDGMLSVDSLYVNTTDQCVSMHKSHATNYPVVAR